MVDVKRTALEGSMGIVLDRDSAVPIAAQLEEQLTWLIATHALGPGDRLPSIRQLGAALGIHHHTVRHAYRELDARGLISVRHGAAATVKEFASLMQARPRYAGAMQACGVLIAAHVPFYLPFLRGVEAGAAETQALVIVSATDDSLVKAKLQMHQFVAAGVRGIIAMSMGGLVQEEFEDHGPGRAIPIVYCDQPVRAEEAINFDDRRAGFELAGHLASHGHRRVSLMTPSLEYSNLAALHSGFQQAVDSGTIDAVDVLLCAGFSIEDGVSAATAALASAVPPKAIATVADDLALGVITAARDMGVRIPDDLALLSYGNIDAAAFVDLTTFALPAQEMGLLAARRLAARIRGEPAQGSTILPGHLVVRASCGHHASSGEE